MKSCRPAVPLKITKAGRQLPGNLFEWIEDVFRTTINAANEVPFVPIFDRCEK